jgi:hypothetical protein
MDEKKYKINITLFYAQFNFLRTLLMRFLCIDAFSLLKTG